MERETQFMEINTHTDPNKFAETIERVIQDCPSDKLSPEILDLMAETLWKLKL